MNKTDYLRKKGLLRPLNDDILYIVHSTQKGVTLKSYPVIRVSEEHIHDGCKSRLYYFSINNDGNEEYIFMNVDSRFGQKGDTLENFTNYMINLWEYTMYAYFDKLHAQIQFEKETEKINKLFINRKTIDSSITKIKEIQYRIENLNEQGYNFKNITDILNKYNVPDPLPALLHKLMYSCDNELDEEIKFLKNVKKELNNKFYPAQG